MRHGVESGVAHRAVNRHQISAHPLLSSAFMLAVSSALACGEDDAKPSQSDDGSVDEGELDDSDDDESTKSSKGEEDDVSWESGESDDDGDESEDEDSVDPSIDPDVDTPRFDLGSVPDFEHPSKDAICNIDFLFVIDNSTSMIDNQINLTRSVPEFISVLEGAVDIESMNIGVVTTDEFKDNGPPCAKRLGALVTRTREGFFGPFNECAPYSSGLSFMTGEDDLDEKFTCAAVPGSTGSPWELPMNSMLHAIRPEMTAPGACNEGFLRDDAMLVVTVITDEDEDPTAPWWMKDIGDPQSWYDEVVALKGEPERVVVLGLLSIPPPNQCRSQDGNSRMISEFIGLFGPRGHIGDVCADSYGEFFEDAVGVIDFACDNLPEG